MRDEMEIIKDLMEELKNAMEYGESDLNERLGRAKPEMEVLKIESEESPEMGMEMEISEELPEDEKLKDRLSKLRG